MTAESRRSSTTTDAAPPKEELEDENLQSDASESKNVTEDDAAVPIGEPVVALAAVLEPQTPRRTDESVQMADDDEKKLKKIKSRPSDVTVELISVELVPRPVTERLHSFGVASDRLITEHIHISPRAASPDAALRRYGPSDVVFGGSDPSLDASGSPKAGRNFGLWLKEKVNLKLRMRSSESLPSDPQSAPAAALPRLVVTPPTTRPKAAPSAPLPSCSSAPATSNAFARPSLTPPSPRSALLPPRTVPATAWCPPLPEKPASVPAPMPLSAPVSVSNRSPPLRTGWRPVPPPSDRKPVFTPSSSLLSSSSCPVVGPAKPPRRPDLEAPPPPPPEHKPRLSSVEQTNYATKWADLRESAMQCERTLIYFSNINFLHSPAWKAVPYIAPNNLYTSHWINFIAVFFSF